MLNRLALIPLLSALLISVPAAAADGDAPYWASITASEVNMRVGPGEDYRILWTYKRKGLPLKVVRLKEGWRLVEDPDGAKGWVLARFLSRARTAYVTAGDPAAMRDAGQAGARMLWKVAPGVTGSLGDCAGGWCEFAVGPRKGFVEEARLWGAGHL